MSTGDNKPGLRDIRSLRERLGMLNKGGEGEQPAKADAPQPSEPAESNEIQQTEQSAPQPASPQPAAPAKPSAPAAPSGFGQFDVFSKRETPSQPVESSPAEAPAEAAESGLDAFANPFQVGDYRQASAPAVMSAEEQAELQAYEKQSRGVSGKLLWAVAGAVGVVSLAIGAMLTSASQERRFVNASIDTSVRINDSVAKAMATIEQLQTVVAGLKAGSIDFKATEKIPDNLVRLDGTAFLYSPFPLTKEVAPLVAKFVSDANQLIDQASQHRKLTLFRDRKALDAIVNGLGPMHGKALALRALPPQEGRGPQVELVGILSKKPIVKKIKVPGQGKRAQTREVRYFKIIDRGGKTDEVPGDGLLTISKNHLFIDGQANVFSLYQQRVRRMQLFASEIEKYKTHFMKTLKEQAGRERVTSFF